MGERYAPGQPVRARPTDPPGHTRVPRYVRGRVGTVVEPHGRYPLPDDVTAGLPDPRRETVYTVRFAAAELFGAGEHHVTVDLWDSYLEAADQAATDPPTPTPTSGRPGR
jgi:hypothetical protein